MAHSFNVNTPMYHPANVYSDDRMYQCPYCAYMTMCLQEFWKQYHYVPNINQAGAPMELKDYGPNPFVVNIEEATKQNNCFRIALWTGKHLQLTLMSINVGEDIGLECHPNLDQFIRIEEGQGLVTTSASIWYRT